MFAFYLFLENERFCFIPIDLGIEADFINIVSTILLVWYVNIHLRTYL